MHSEMFNVVHLCTFCLSAIDNDECEPCRGCGEFICEPCPSFGCACIDDDPEISALRVELRAGAIELAQLQAERKFMGADSLTVGQQSRLRFLNDVVASLVAAYRKTLESQVTEVRTAIDEARLNTVWSTTFRDGWLKTLQTHLSWRNQELDGYDEMMRRILGT